MLFSRYCGGLFCGSVRRWMNVLPSENRTQTRSTTTTQQHALSVSLPFFNLSPSVHHYEKVISTSLTLLYIIFGSDSEEWRCYFRRAPRGTHRSVRHPTAIVVSRTVHHYGGRSLAGARLSLFIRRNEWLTI